MSAAMPFGDAALNRDRSRNSLSPADSCRFVATTDQVQEQEGGMSMGALLLWGILGLFVSLVVYRLVTA